MAGKEVYRYAVRQLAESSQSALRHAGLAVEEVDQFLFHQANLRIIESVQNAVNIPAEKTYLNIERYGNTSAASVPMALVEALAEDRIKPGDKLLWWSGPLIRLVAAWHPGHRPASVRFSQNPSAPMSPLRSLTPDRRSMFELTGRVALVTGGSRGLGRAIALAFARQGADVAVNYRGNAEAAEAVVAELSAVGRRAVAIQGDTSQGRESCETIVKAAIDALGTIDILVNNAGITRDNLLMRMDTDEWDAVISTNLSGPFWMTRAIARPMLKARRGRIINMSSAAGRMGNAGQANYAAAKAGLIGLTKTTARELASRGITCNAIAPGLIETDLTADLPAAATEALRAMTPLGYVGSIDDVAAAAVYLASDEARYVTGQVLGVDGGIVMGS
jgi:3-oxoacyl-[acyl-carrier protein] reductase